MLSKEARQLLLKEGFQIYKIKDNLYVLLKEESPQKSNKEKEMDLLWKISKMDYKERHINKVRKKLTPEERKMLDSMLKRKVIYLNKDIIAFPAQLYEQLKERTRMKYLKEKDLDYDILTPDEFKEFMKRPDYQSYTTLLNYDGQVYVIKTKLLHRLLERIAKLNIQKTTPEQLAKQLGIPEKLALIVLRMMAEQGEFVESEPGVYERV
ncbi:MAG: hypothetical protein GXN92_00355 [Candidatus Micrarchaeota archaeon]|nr:hypothetical protein [Candidatus Micrarchaeota archaeon]